MKKMFVCRKAKICRREKCEHNKPHGKGISCAGMCAHINNGWCEEIIPPKKKDVVVDAWVYPYNGRFRITTDNPMLKTCRTCTIHIKAEDWKKLTGNQYK